jgi:hypothetical protein
MSNADDSPTTRSEEHMVTRSASLLLAATLGLLGCASIQGATWSPIDGVSAVAGTWTGTVTPGHWAVADPFTITITPDGQLTAKWDSNTAWGKVTVANGRATFEMEPTIFEGTIRLFESGGGKRELVLDDEVQSLSARVVQQK